MFATDSEIDMQKKISDYETFVNEVLRNDLKRVMARQERVCTQMAHYSQVSSFAKGIRDKSYVHSEQRPLKLMTDIGSNFYAQCVVPNPQTIIVNIGLGYYLEYTLDEAIRFIDKKEKLLNEDLKSLTIQSAKIKAHIKLILESLTQLQGLSNTDEH